MANNSLINISLSQDPTKFRTNTEWFSPHDFKLFIDSLETIQRLCIEREQKKEKDKVKQSIKNRFCSALARICSESILCTSTVTSSHANEDETLSTYLENTTAPTTPDSQRYQYDEPYFSAPNSTGSSPRSSVVYQQKLCKIPSGSTISTSISSESKESGIFTTGALTPQDSQIRCRSKVITKTRPLSTRSGLIGLVLKKESKKVPCVELLSCRPLDEYETLQMYEQERQRQQHFLNNEHLKETKNIYRFSTLHIKKKPKLDFGSVERSAGKHFLHKALRYLTL